MAFVAPFMTKRERILSRLDKGESVDAIMIAEHTSRAYVYNLRSKRRKQMRASEDAPPPPPTTNPATHDLPVETDQAGRVPMKPTPAATSPVPGAVVTGTLPLETPIEDPISDNLRRNLIQTRNRVEILRQRRTLARQNLELSLEERREREEWEEQQIRLVIFNQCPDPRDMFMDRSRYVGSMLRILQNVEPFRTLLLRIVDSDRGLWGQDQMIRACLWQSYALTVDSGVDGPISRTLLRDHVVEFLRGLVNPAGGYCPRDHYPVLPCGPGGFCTKYHWWSLDDDRLIRTESAILHPTVALLEEIRT